MREVKENILKEIYHPREKESHKYDYGLLVIIGGSEFYSGSPALSAFSALRAGVDMVYIISPKRSADIIASFSPVLAAFPLEEKRLTKKSLSFLIEMLESAKAVSHGKAGLVIGGGLGRSPETRETVVSLLKEVLLPTVIDADAIYAVSENKEIIRGRPFILTPHTYEFFVLSGKEVKEKNKEERGKIVEEIAGKLETNIILKGAEDIISNGKETVVNKTGTPYLSKGGTGDTLAGICGALLARGIDPFLAAQAGVFINGKAGELATKKYKQSLLATDLIESIPEVIKEYA